MASTCHKLPIAWADVRCKGFVCRILECLLSTLEQPPPAGKHPLGGEALLQEPTLNKTSGSQQLIHKFFIGSFCLCTLTRGKHCCDMHQASVPVIVTPVECMMADVRNAIAVG